jgi:hypothetical protein
MPRGDAVPGDGNTQGASVDRQTEHRFLATKPTKRQNCNPRMHFVIRMPLDCILKPADGHQVAAASPIASSIRTAAAPLKTPQARLTVFWWFFQEPLIQRAI